ncbi:hypothetical protein [Xenorhabdus bovienii]|uniref:hypothetical protein n=1 Tax=Xenorhabdus bovienii TaxID=40576 RepID=UPI003DA2DFF1
MYFSDSSIKRIVVTGNSPGCGKTYISHIVHKITGLPLYHLDCIFWKKEWKSVTEEEFLGLQDEIVHKGNWILEGGYVSSLRHRATHADMVIVIQTGKWQSLWRVIKRRLKSGGMREDLPEGCKDKVDLGFLVFIIKTFHQRHDRIMQQLTGLNIPIHIIRNEKALPYLFSGKKE